MTTKYHVIAGLHSLKLKGKVNTVAGHALHIIAEHLLMSLLFPIITLMLVAFNNLTWQNCFTVTIYLCQIYKELAKLVTGETSKSYVKKKQTKKKHQSNYKNPKSYTSGGNFYIMGSCCLSSAISLCQHLVTTWPLLN